MSYNRPSCRGGSEADEICPDSSSMALETSCALASCKHAPLTSLHHSAPCGEQRRVLSGGGGGSLDPFSPYATIPLPFPYGIHPFAFEPAFIRRRNERERQRVRCVNDGYARLRDHLPMKEADKRLSKVETLRSAIDYIKHLEDILKSENRNTAELSKEAQTSNVKYAPPVREAIVKENDAYNYASTSDED